MKNTIYVVVIVACIILAVVVFVKSRSTGSAGIDSIASGEQIWVKCNNKACNAAYEMGKKDFYQQMEEKAKSTSMLAGTPALKCRDCGEDSVFRAVKCENCGEIFFYGVPGDFADRCPKCKYSAIEAERKARVSGRQ